MCCTDDGVKTGFCQLLLSPHEGLEGRAVWNIIQSKRHSNKSGLNVALFIWTHNFKSFYHMNWTEHVLYLFFSFCFGSGFNRNSGSKWWPGWSMLTPTYLWHVRKWILRHFVLEQPRASARRGTRGATEAPSLSTLLPLPSGQPIVHQGRGSSADKWLHVNHVWQGAQKRTPRVPWRNRQPHITVPEKFDPRPPNLGATGSFYCFTLWLKHLTLENVWVPMDDSFMINQSGW